MNILKAKLHPYVIVSSVLFWFVLFFGIYLCLVVYFFQKYINGDHNLRVDEGATAYILIRVNKKIYRCKIKRYTDKIVVR